MFSLSIKRVKNDTHAHYLAFAGPKDDGIGIAKITRLGQNFFGPIWQVEYRKPQKIRGMGGTYLGKFENFDSLSEAKESIESRIIEAISREFSVD